MASFTGGAVAADTKLGAMVENLARTKQAKADFQSMGTALAMYKLNAGVYPTEKQGLASLVEKPVVEPAPRRWIQIMKKIPKDPWGRDYRYIERKDNEQEVHVLVSDGAEMDKTSDDIEFVLEKAGK